MLREAVASKKKVFRRIGHGPNTESIDHQHNDTSNHGRTIAEARRIGYGGVARDKREERDWREKRDA